MCDWALGRELSGLRTEGVMVSPLSSIMHTQITMLIHLVPIKSLWSRYSDCSYPHVGQENRLRARECGRMETGYSFFESLLLHHAMWPCQVTTLCLCLSLFLSLKNEEKDNEKLTSLDLLGGSSQLNYCIGNGAEVEPVSNSEEHSSMVWTSSRPPGSCLGFSLWLDGSMDV